MGSGFGDSAIWFPDLPRAFGSPAVTFLEGDVNLIESVLSKAGSERAPRPWIEDTHVNTFGVMRFLAGAMQAGDYLVAVDTRFTDFFGINTASVVDSIFVRI